MSHTITDDEAYAVLNQAMDATGKRLDEICLMGTALVLDRMRADRFTIKMSLPDKGRYSITVKRIGRRK